MHAATHIWIPRLIILVFWQTIIPFLVFQQYNANGIVLSQMMKHLKRTANKPFILTMYYS